MGILMIALAATSDPVRAGEPAGSIAAVVDKRIRAQQTDAVDRELATLPYESPEERELREVRQTRIGTAQRMGDSMHAALVPMAVVLSLLGAESTTDLFLSLFPVGKAAALIKRIRKARKHHKKRRALVEQLAGSLDDGEQQFILATRRLQKTQLDALVAIHKHVDNPRTITTLAIRARNDQVDLEWMHWMLAEGKMTGELVENFTHYDANPSWTALRGVLDNSLRGKSRRSVMSKLVGFLGEEGAERYARSKGFEQRYSRGHGGFQLRRGEEKLDLVGWTKGDKVVVFAEVKNWSAELWKSASKRNEVIEQLKEHNRRANNIVADSRSLPERVEKVLIVNARGYTTMDDQIVYEFAAALKAVDWRLDVMPSTGVPTVDEFINRLR